jgi:hypothetical protein
MLIARPQDGGSMYAWTITPTDRDFEDLCGAGNRPRGAA